MLFWMLLIIYLFVLLLWVILGFRCYRKRDLLAWIVTGLVWPIVLPVSMIEGIYLDRLVERRWRDWHGGKFEERRMLRK